MGEGTMYEAILEELKTPHLSLKDYRESRGGGHDPRYTKFQEAALDIAMRVHDAICEELGSDAIDMVDDEYVRKWMCSSCGEEFWMDEISYEFCPRCGERLASPDTQDELQKDISCWAEGFDCDEGSKEQLVGMVSEFLERQRKLDGMLDMPFPCPPMSD